MFNATRPAGWLDISLTVRTWFISRSNLNFIPVFREDSHPAPDVDPSHAGQQGSPRARARWRRGGSRSTLAPRA